MNEILIRVKTIIIAALINSIILVGIGFGAFFYGEKVQRDNTKPQETIAQKPIQLPPSQGSQRGHLLPIPLVTEKQLDSLLEALCFYAVRGDSLEEELDDIKKQLAQVWAPFEASFQQKDFLLTIKAFPPEKTIAYDITFKPIELDSVKTIEVEKIVILPTPWYRSDCVITAAVIVAGGIGYYLGHSQ